MSLYRISATQLEAYRKFMTEDWAGEEDLLRTLKRVPFSNEYMKQGTAFHEMVEDPLKHITSAEDTFCEIVLEECGEYAYRLPLHQAHNAHNLIKGACEVKDTRLLDLGADQIELVGKVDWINGVEVGEIKTRWGSFDERTFRRYSEGCQWKVYSYVFNAPVVHFQLFEMDCQVEGRIKYLSVKNTHTWQERSYPALEADLRALLSGLMEYAHKRGVAKFLEKANLQAA